MEMLEAFKANSEAILYSVVALGAFMFFLFRVTMWLNEKRNGGPAPESVQPTRADTERILDETREIKTGVSEVHTRVDEVHQRVSRLGKDHVETATKLDSLEKQHDGLRTEVQSVESKVQDNRVEIAKVKGQVRRIDETTH